VNDESGVRSILPILFWGLPTLAALVVLLQLRPALFRDPIILGSLILFEIVLASLWHYQKLYFPLTMITFVLAGADVPFAGAALSARWLVLGVGALAGAAIWMRGRRQSFSLLHLAAFLCVPAATVSAIDSNDPATALLKVASLFLLFLYCSTGIRFALSGREADFMQGLLLGCEITVFGTGLFYAVGWAFWYNPNSLGAVIGVAMTPFILWGFLIAETRGVKYRRGVGLLICLILLFVSLSRASIMAALVTSIAVCICLRRQRLLIEGAFLLVLMLAVAAVIQPTRFEQFSSNLTTDILYKGKKEQGVFGSRESPWQETVASLKRHPWFGTGFGTSDVGSKGTQVAKLSVMEGIYTNEGTNREHGNSYLALAEYLGLLGMIPFTFLLLLVVRMIVQIGLWMRRVGDPRHYAVPLSMVLLGGLVHAFFEDWLLAVGYYLCLFFWVCVFLLDDLLPERRPLHLATASPAHPRTFAPASAPISSP
jgi:O-antigen ligase